MSETRERIASHVEANPGVHFNALARRLDLAPGQVQYHLRRLLDEAVLVAESLHGRTHYYPPGYDAWEREALALLRRETAADVVAVLVERGPTAPADVADRVGIARSTLQWHLDRLVAADLVEKRRDGRHRVTLAVAHPERTAALLARATPSLPERLVDRFTRLVDALLAE